MRIIAEVLVVAGNCTVKDPLDVLVDPKSKTQTAGFVVLFFKYINAPRALIAPVHTALLKETYAVSPDVPVVGVCETTSN